MRLILRSALWLSAVCALLLVWTLFLGARSMKVLLRECEGGYCLRVAEGAMAYGLLYATRRYEIWITREVSPDYGYQLDHSFGFSDFDTEKTIRGSRVTWSAEGVTLTEPSGQRVFVPIHLYQGGR